MSEGSKEYFDFLRKLENDPKFCYEYLEKNSFYKDHPTYELCLKTISKCSETSMLAAEKIIKGRFLLAEDAIAKSSKESFYYAKDIIKDRWEKGEEAIAKSAQYSFLYAKRILRGRFELGEKTIAQDEKLCCKYALEIIRGKLPEEMHNVMLARQIEK